MNLPTMEEFKAQERPNTISFDVKGMKDEPLFECPKCQGEMHRDISVVYMTYPPKYKYFCKECGFKTIF